MHIRQLLVTFLILFSIKAYCQQDVDFHLNAHLLSGKKVLKVKRDFYDPYLWVLAQNNEVFRINSITLQIDDYTSAFSSYNNLQFIDIAGRSQDTVFIATNSTNVIEYKKGVLRIIGQPDGLSGTINEVGMDHIYEKYGQAFSNNLVGIPVLLIGTTANIYYYDCRNEVVVPSGQISANNHLYETTYRTESYGDAGNTYGYDPSKQLDVIHRIGYTEYEGDFWFNMPEFGYHIYTGYYTTGSYLGYNQPYNDVIYMDQVWGTENGLFENNWNFSYFLTSAYRHYLVGLKVNKVTSIYGLVSFGSETTKGLTRENLLVGTDNGFYFSSSGYLKYGVGTVRDYDTFTLDTQIGKQVINDVCVNATSYTKPICEDGVWVAANDGLYCLKPDFGKYINVQQVQAAVFKDMDNTISSKDICSGSSVTALISNDIYNGNSIQWYKDGAELPGERNSSLLINSAGDYYAVLYDPCSVLHLETNHLTVQVVSSPVFTFNYPDELRYCSGTPVTLKAESSAGYQYRWYKDGTLTGDTAPSLSITQSGKYKIEVSACDGSWVPSKEVQVDLIDVPTPLIAADKPAYCIGDNATLSLSVDIDPSYTINWYKDNILLPAYTNQTSVSATGAGSYTASITDNEQNSDGSTCTKISAAQSIIFNPPPTVSIQKIVKTTLCNGQTVDLKVNYSEGTVKWSTGDDIDQISVTQSGTYKATVTSEAGCISDASVDVRFFPNPVLNISDALICGASHKTVTLTAPAGLVSYSWNGQSGTNTYVADRSQMVTLTVTDANGCQATQDIKITDECPDVKIPNAFTPNGDGVNDTWNITGLEYDQTALVRIFTRYGQQVYQSKGYGTPWNGEAKGQKLPTGAYYYIIIAKNGSQTYSGEVTIIY